MGYHKVSEPEDITNQYTHSGEEAVPLTSSTKLTTEKQQTITDEVPPHLEPYLQTQPTFGLTDDQVIERRNRFGRNELTEKKRNKLLHFLSFCKHKDNSPEKEILTFLFSYRSHFISNGNIPYIDSFNKGLA